MTLYIDFVNIRIVFVNKGRSVGEVLQFVGSFDIGNSDLRDYVK